MESGMAFAQSHMAKCGWKEGRGLGREETGMTEAIKVKLKFDSAGFGHDRAEEFTFQWWDHVFNKAADNLSVIKNEKGEIELQQKEKLVVSKSRPEAARAAMKEKLYGSFVKGATLRGSKEMYPENSSDDESAESDEDDEPRDMSMKLSDDQLFKLCGGRTAHKGARHGLNMSAKLERIRLQEEELMRKWKSEEAQQATSSQLKSSLNNGIQHTENDTPTEKKKKKKKHKDVSEESLSNIGYEETKNKRKYTSDEENSGEMKKKKKKNKHLDQSTMNDSGIESVEYEITKIKEKKKKKRKEYKVDEENKDFEIKSKVEHMSEEQEQSKKKKKKCKKDKNESRKISEIGCDSLDFSEVEVKKKKKKSKEIDANVEEENLEINGLCSEELNNISTECKEKKKKKKEKLLCSDTEEIEVKKKKKKSKRSKEKEYEENELSLENCNLSAITKESKKKKKKIKESV